MLARRAWGWVALACGIALLLGGGALLYRGLSQMPERPAVDLSCPDLVAGCLLPAQRLRIVFDRYPRSMQPFQLLVEAPDAREVHASFVMSGMQMGLNRYRLLADGPGRWKAEITLPVCTEARNDWVMTLDVDGQRYQLQFRSR